jgi:amidohydrolase family protein
MRWSFALVLTVAATNVGAADRFDVVIRGGRVMDPETGRDGVLNVGLVGDRIASISAEPLEGARVIDARGLVVAPGFIDLHQHSFSPENDQLKARDGVTTALEMEIGRSDVAAFLAERRGHALVHFGTTASQQFFEGARPLGQDRPRLGGQPFQVQSGAARTQDGVHSGVQNRLERRAQGQEVLRRDQVQGAAQERRARTILRCSSSATSLARAKPSTRLQRPRKGGGGHWACIATKRSMAWSGAMRWRASSSWRARVARLIWRRVSGSAGIDGTSL